MKGKKALEKLYFDNKDLKVDIALNDFKVCEIYNIIKQDLDRLEKVEKDLKQTKSNFKNSQTHSRNCYKKLLDRYMGLEKENQELKEKVKILEENEEAVLTTLESAVQENEKLKERYKHRAETSNDLCKEVRQYEKAFEILKEKKVDIPKLLANDFNNYNALSVFFGFKQLTQEEYELLREVL